MVPSELPVWFDDECRLLSSIRAAPDLLSAVYSDAPELGLQSRLRDLYSPEMVREALQLRDLRRRAVKKFSQAAEMWFDRTGLEQSTSEEIAHYKAQRFHTADQISDWCCGIGGDAIALAQFSDVNAVDSRPVNCLRTQWNAQVYDRPYNIRVNWCGCHDT